MLDTIKKYWDIFGGVIVGLGLSFIAELKLEKIQLAYSMIILVLVSIGILKILKQAFEKNHTKRRETIIEKGVDSFKPIKAIRLAEHPTEDGEEIGNLILTFWRYLRIMLNRFKLFFDKFKGIALSVLLCIVTIVEYCGGYISQLCRGVFVVGGVDFVTLALLICSIVVAAISNPYSKEQKLKIKEICKKKSIIKNTALVDEIRQSLRNDEIKLKDLKRELGKKEKELETLISEQDYLNSKYEAKVSMKNNVPPLATEDDCSNALAKLNVAKQKVDKKKAEIEKEKALVDNLKEKITNLKNKLYEGR